MNYNGSEILIKSLINENVDTIFGFPGGAVLNIYDALYKNSDKINHILTCHEQSAAHAADGYARVTGKVGVCLATSGPGATNLVTGIATAYMDSIPLVVITGNVAKNLLGKDSFQEVDIVGITMPITKHNYIVDNILDLEHIVHEAFKIAREGKKGPVLIDIPKDITASFAEFKDLKPLKPSKKSINKIKIEEAIKIINESKKPFIYAGGGVVSSGADKEMREFAKKIDSPVALSLMGIGATNKEDKLLTGMIGMHGTKASNVGVIESDLLIAIGARFSDRVISNSDYFQENTKVLHIDIDEAEIDKNIKSHSSVIGDIKEILNILIPKVNSKENTKWIERIEELKAMTRMSKEEKECIIKPKDLFDKINEITKGEDIIATEVGQHQMWAAQYADIKRIRQFITSGGLGTMGYGLGAAIGACIGKNNAKVINIAGDGSFMMNAIELTTAATYNLNVIVIILNNGVLGMVRQWQSFFYEGRYSSTTLNRKTDYVKLAEAQGVKGFRALNIEEFEKALIEAKNHEGPCLIDVQIEQNENVHPMVAPGKSIDDLII